MTAVLSPYRLTETPLLARERIIEDDLAQTRELLAGYANEEVRVSRRVLVGEATDGELESIRASLEALGVKEEQLECELVEVRAELVARGERKTVAKRREDPASRIIVPLLGIVAVVCVFLIQAHLRESDTAFRAPPEASFEWGGPLEPGQTWLYVEGPPGAGFTVDGRFFRTPRRIPISALHGHDLRPEAGQDLHVRWIPCTTALVRLPPGPGEPSVERFFNHATCF